MESAESIALLLSLHATETGISLDGEGHLARVQTLLQSHYPKIERSHLHNSQLQKAASVQANYFCFHLSIYRDK